MELYRSTCIAVLGQFANCDGQIQRYQTKTKRLVISVAMMSLNLQRERQIDPSFEFLLNVKRAG